jgi:hypothetical protein
MSTLQVTDDGWAEVTIGESSQRIDLYRTYNAFLAIDKAVREQFPDDKDVASRAIAYLDQVCEHLAKLGFSAVSHRAADAFDDALMKAVDELGKVPAGGPTPA